MQIIRPQQAAEKLGIGLSTIWHKARKEPGFPQPIKLSAGITGFLASELDAYLEGRASEFRKQPNKKLSVADAAKASATKRARNNGGLHD